MAKEPRRRPTGQRKPKPPPARPATVQGIVDKRREELRRSWAVLILMQALEDASSSYLQYYLCREKAEKIYDYLVKQRVIQ
jgi:hypothetical protein